MDDFRQFYKRLSWRACLNKFLIKKNSSKKLKFKNQTRVPCESSCMKVFKLHSVSFHWISNCGMLQNITNCSVRKNSDSNAHGLHKKWSFPLRISSVSATKFTVSYGFHHIYWRNNFFFIFSEVYNVHTSFLSST